MTTDPFRTPEQRPTVLSHEQPGEPAFVRDHGEPVLYEEAADECEEEKGNPGDWQPEMVYTTVHEATSLEFPSGDVNVGACVCYWHEQRKAEWGLKKKKSKCPRDRRAPPTADPGNGLFWNSRRPAAVGKIIGRYTGRQLGPVSAFEDSARPTRFSAYTIEMLMEYKRDEWLDGLEEFEDGKNKGLVFVDGKDSPIGFQYANCAPADEANVKVTPGGYV